MRNPKKSNNSKVSSSPPERTVRQNARYARTQGTPERKVRQNARYARTHGTPERTVRQNALYARTHGMPERTVRHNARYATTHGTPQRTVRHNARYATTHGAPQRTVRHNARCATTHGAPQRTVRHKARCATTHGAPQRTVRQNARYARMHGTPECTMQWTRLLHLVTLFLCPSIAHDGEARLLASKTLLNKIAVDGKDLNVQYNLYNIGSSAAFEVELHDDSFSADDFGVVSGTLTAKWERIAPASNVSHNVVLRPLRSGYVNFTMATLSYLAHEGADPTVGFTSSPGRNVILGHLYYKTKFSTQYVSLNLFGSGSRCFLHHSNNPLWAGAPASHLARLHAVETKAFRISEISRDEANSEGLSLTHRRQLDCIAFGMLALPSVGTPLT
uniref:uncharacterized protein n=1 Tax=Myxine glutinosa TaxID=7769 RepID=UPI00358DED36